MINNSARLELVSTFSDRSIFTAGSRWSWERWWVSVTPVNAEMMVWYFCVRRPQGCDWTLACCIDLDFTWIAYFVWLRSHVFVSFCLCNHNVLMPVIFPWCNPWAATWLQKRLETSNSTELRWVHLLEWIVKSDSWQETPWPCRSWKEAILQKYRRNLTTVNCMGQEWALKLDICRHLFTIFSEIYVVKCVEAVLEKSFTLLLESNKVNGEWWQVSYLLCEVKSAHWIGGVFYVNLDPYGMLILPYIWDFVGAYKKMITIFGVISI